MHFKLFPATAILITALFSLTQVSLAQTSTAFSHPHATLLGDGGQGTVLQFHFADPAFNTVETSEGDAIIPRVGDDFPLLIKGSPDLSKSSVAILINGQSRTSIEVLSSEFSDYENIEIAPSKGNLFRNIEPSEIAYVKGEQYSVDSFFPTEVASLNSPFIQSGVRGQAVWVYPMQYNPITKILRVYTSITLRVIDVDGASSNTLAVGSQARLTAELKDGMSRRFINSESASTRYDLQEEHGKIIFITDPIYDAAIAPLVQWKREKGLETEVVYASDLGGIAGIKSFLSDQYFNEGLTHVIIAGDEDQIPSELVNNSGGSGFCDPCYSYVDGNDNYPDFFVGRLLTHNVTEMLTVVSRTLEYEKNPSMDENWFNTAVGMGSNEGAGIGDEGESDWEHQNNLKDLLLDYGFNEVWEVYDGSQGGSSVSSDGTQDVAGSPNAGDMITIINKGNSLINYCGHGYHDGVATSGFDSNAINQLNNHGMYPFFVPVACCVGDFDEGEGSGDCFGEVWSKATNSNGEAIGGIGGAFSSVLQSWAPPMEGQDEMVNLIVEQGAVAIHHTTGSIVSHGCASMNDVYGGQGDEMTDTWCVFGDPSVVLRTATPTQLQLVHQNVYFLGTPALQISCSTEGALVAITVGSEILGTAFVVGGVADITLYAPLSLPGNILITGTAYNTLPYQAFAQVVPAEGPYVIANNPQADDISGDMDGVVDQGESIVLDLDLENVGIEVAANVMVTITTSDLWVNITSGALSAGNISEGGTLTLEGFAFDVVGGVEDGHIALFLVDIADSAGNSWDTQFNITLNAPSLTVVGLTVADGGNGILESGENADLIIEVLNEGHDWAYSLQNLIDISHPDVTVNNVTYNSGSVAEGMTTTAIFNIDISPSAGLGELLSIGFTGTAGLYGAEAEFIEVINLIVENWESGTTDTFNWEMEGNQPWFITSENPYQGVNCLQSGDINDSQTSTLVLDLDVLADGMVSFVRKVDCELDYDYLYFIVDGEFLGEWSGSSGWVEEEFLLTAGSHTLEWRYEKDFIVSSGSDAAWVDDIVLPPFCNLDASITSSQAEGVLCPGTVATLSTTEGYTTVWSTGSEETSIEVSETGSYYVTLSDGNGCETTSDLYFVEVYYPTPPSISIDGQLAMCGDGSVTLEVSQDGTYIWSNQATTSSITVSEDGMYSVVFTDVCGAVTNSEQHEVIQYPALSVPDVSDIEIDNPGNAFFVGAPESAAWYINENDVTPIATGSSFTTFVSETSTYWVEDLESHPGTQGSGGPTEKNVNGQYQGNSTRYLLFDAYQPFTLESVRVYANGDGNRTIQLIDAFAGELASITVFLPDGESVVDLGFAVPTGGGLGLRTTDGNPQLWRDGNGSNPAYPYEIGSMGAITTSSIPGTNALNFYFFFYDWQVSTDELICTSERVPVVVDVLSSVGEIDGVEGINVYPVPATDILNVDIQLLTAKNLNVTLYDATGRVVIKEVWSNISSGVQTINLSACSPGLYNLNIEDNNSRIISRVIVE